MKKSLLTLMLGLGLSTFCAAAETTTAEPAKVDAKADKAEAKAGKKGGRGMTAVDTNKDGMVSMEEFSAMPRNKNRDKDKVEEAFKKMDADSNGSISEEEMKAGAPGKKGDKAAKGDEKADATPTPAPKTDSKTDTAAKPTVPAASGTATTTTGAAATDANTPPAPDTATKTDSAGKTSTSKKTGE